MKLISALIVVTAFSGCATILNDDMQTITISSTAEKLKGNIDGIPFRGPGVVSVKRAKADKIINIETAGCQRQTALSSTVDPKFFINIISGGTFGSTTDYASEKMWKYQDQVVIPCR